MYCSKWASSRLVPRWASPLPANNIWPRPARGTIRAAGRRARNHAGVRAGHTRRSRSRWAMASGRGRWPRRRETASYFRGARTGFQQHRGADARFRAGFALREAVLAREPAGRFAPEAGFSGQERSAGPRPWRGWTALAVHTTTGATLPSGDCAGAAVSANHTWLPAPSRAPGVGEYRL